MSIDRRISKSLSYWLRHAPEAGGLMLDGAGWARVDQVLAALQAADLPSTRKDLERVAAASDKQRFELAGEHVRARQGHSVPVEGDWRQEAPPDLLYHGTVEHFLPAILEQGLLPRTRHHVHLSPDVATAAAVGSRRGQPVILEVQAGALAATGVAFFLSGNGVWLIDHVPPSFLRPVEDCY